MSKTYNALEGDVTVSGTGTTTRTGATNAVAIVGGYDANNAASGVNAGESTTVTDPANAEDQFGTSELARAAALVGSNQASPIYGIPVAETTTTESISNGSSITLSNTPLFDPNVHPDEDITVTDTDTQTDLTVNVVYDKSVSTPSDSDTANVNPVTGDVEIDASGNYDIDYTYGDYSAAISTAVDESVRNVIVLTEEDTVKSTLQTELANIANDFDFKRGFVGARPEISSGSISSYTPSTDDWRVVEVAPARATGPDGMVRTCAAIGSYMAAQPIGPDGSGLFESISGIVSLNTEYRDSEAKDFSRVTSVTREGVIGTADTTSSTDQFQKIYAAEIIDRVAVSLFDTIRDYAGGPQNIGRLETELEVTCQRFASGSPPDLGFAQSGQGEPYDVSVTLGNSNDVADAAVTIVPYPVAETVNLSLNVSDGFVQFQGAA